MKSGGRIDQRYVQINKKLTKIRSDIQQRDILNQIIITIQQKSIKQLFLDNLISEKQIQQYKLQINKKLIIEYQNKYYKYWRINFFVRTLFTKSSTITIFANKFENIKVQIGKQISAKWRRYKKLEGRNWKHQCNKLNYNWYWYWLTLKGYSIFSQLSIHSQYCRLPKFEDQLSHKLTPFRDIELLESVENKQRKHIKILSIPNAFAKAKTQQQANYLSGSKQILHINLDSKIKYTVKESSQIIQGTEL